MNTKSNCMLKIYPLNRSNLLRLGCVIIKKWFYNSNLIAVFMSEVWVYCYFNMVSTFPFEDKIGFNLNLA